jgi:hypothetical protein
MAALNALLAEHCLGLIELVAMNPFAAELREGIMSAFRVGSPFPQNEEAWSTKFNNLSRVVQLNFVAMGFNELGMLPSLPDEYWRPVRNPFILRGIEHKLDKASRYIERRHGTRVRLRDGKLALLDWGLDDLSKDTPVGASDEEMPSLLFMSEYPDDKANSPAGRLQLGTRTLLYDESPRTLADMTGGPKPFFKCPQVAVVLDRDNKPELMVRIEESPFATSMLCTIEPNGTRGNFGPMSRTDRDAFLARVAQIVSSMTRKQ